MLLNSIFILLIISIIFLFFIPNSNLKLLRLIALSSSGLVFFISCFFLITFSSNIFFFQSVSDYTFGIEVLNISFSVGLDGLSLFFFILSSFLIFLCVLFVWDESFLKEYFIILLFLDLLLLLVFSVLDLLLFYIFFEAILIPMYLIIGIWGSRERKVRAVYLFFFYTLVGSLLMLLGILYIYSVTGTFAFEIILAYNFTFFEQYWLWLAFFFSFASKIPLFPFHIWLPEAHVEAPTVGSVLLAGILLKLGVYGFLRFNLTMYPEASIYFSPLIMLLSTIGIVYTSLTAIRQTDIKRIIAYSSVAHMNLVTLGIFSFNLIGIEGSIIQSLSHGFVSGALFFLIGILYNRYHSRLVYYYGGLVHMMPLYSSFFLLFTMSNIALPGTSSFIGEFLLLLGIYKNNTLNCFFSTISVILGGAYSLWLYNRLIYGNLNINNTLLFKDLTFREFSIILPLALLVIFMGIYPSFFISYIEPISLTLFVINIF